MSGEIDPASSGKKVQQVISEAPSQKLTKSGSFKRWRAKVLELCKKVWLKIGKQSHSDFFRKPKGIEL